MKWIGQHIYNLVSRFRGDVYINGDLYLHQSPQMSGGYNGISTQNRILYGDVGGGGKITHSGDLEYDTNNEKLTIGDIDNGYAYIARTPRAAGETNASGGRLALHAGQGTGSGIGGWVELGTSAPGSSGTSLNSITEKLTLWPDVDSSGFAGTGSGSSQSVQVTMPNGLGIYGSSPRVVYAPSSSTDTSAGVIFTRRVEGVNSADELTTLLNETVKVVDMTDTDESAWYELGVRTSDGTTSSLKSAISAIGSSSADTVNVNIGSGATSTTTVAGDLTITGGDITLSGTGRIQGIDTVTDSTDAASKAYVDGAINSDVDLTSEVSGVLPVANGGTGASSLTDNKLLTGTGTSAVTAEANATYDGTDFTLLSASQYKPILKLHNQNNSAESPELLFLNQRTSDASGVSANGDEAGKITFQSINNRGSGAGGPEDITYAQVKGSIFDNTDGGEDGRLALQVTEGGSLTTAFDAYGTGLGTINTFGNGGIFSYSNFDSTLVFFTSSVSTAPNVSISNYADDATGPTLTLGNLRGGISGGKTDGSDNDSCGTINFNAYDDGTPTATTFAKIEGIAKDVSDGAEEGKLTLSVASHDAEIQPGLTIESGDAEDEVDVTIGNGSASVVTVPGFISIGGHAINDIDVAGEFVDSDEHLMTAAAINDRIAAAGGGGGGSSKIHITWQDPQSYLFYLFNNNSWYSTGSSTLALLGTGSSPSDISSSNSEYGARIAIYTAIAACTVNKLTFNWYWNSSAISGTKAFEFAFSKFTPQDGSLGTITMNSITATDNNGNYTEFTPYQETFTFSGGNATLAAGDSIAMHMRTTDGSSSQRVLVYGTITLEAELS